MRTSKKIFIIALCIYLALGLCSMSAFAFEVSTTSGGAEILWAEGGTAYSINSSGGPSGNITALQAAMQTWTDVPSSSFVFVYSGTTSNTAYGANDGQNIVTFGPMGTNGTLAENSFWFFTTGQIIDSDIKFNTSYSWATNGGAGFYDIQNVGTHELGHSLSLGDLYNSTDSDKTMYGYASSGETKKRTLHQDDIDGIAYLYPDTAAYRLSVYVSPSNGGAVTGNGINCGSDCSETYLTETEVVLTATPASGFIFAGWSGACTGVSPSCNVTVDAAQSVTAAFNAAPPSITISAPNGGESWAAGTTQTIRWTYTGNPGTNVKIELYKNGAFNRTISSYATIGSGGNGSYNWMIPSNQAGGSDYTIKIKSATNSSYTDTSDGTFTITGPPPPSITVSVPNGGERWTAGTTQAIRWTYTGNPGTYVKIELYKGVTLNRTISSYARLGSGGNGSYNWMIPSNQAGGSDYTIKIKSATNSSYTDTSDGTFTITGPPPPSITVSIPNGGEPWTAGTTQTIRWTYTGNPGTYVKIELYKGVTLNRTISSYARLGSGGNGSYNWMIPSNQAEGSDYTIKIKSLTNSSYTDMSDGRLHDTVE